MFPRKHYAVSIVSLKTLWGSPWRMLYWYTVFVNVFESLNVPGKFNIWLRERYSVICNIYYCLSKTKCHNNITASTGGLQKCLPRTQERSVVLREATGIVLILPSIFQKFLPLLLLKLEKNKKAVSCKLKLFWFKRISFTLVWMLSLHILHCYFLLTF